ncbi:hypothetical protein ATK36_1205 [Amycolatopsis sulphurea]|uniref:Subtilisin inhibitor-like n=1 Tax=Amycolatopsis sulphurea TaxID=76022 RepID=A0A2A9G466_9PSEU|nr:hypothetical protein [Amycolatopsis sulphurea]PFG57610.1 hypothetical protein ATK36_1205 [Amycolatopsis sulphurea]
MRLSKSVSGPVCVAALSLVCTACSGDPAPPPPPTATSSAASAAPSPSTHAPPPLPAAAETTAQQPAPKSAAPPRKASPAPAPAPGTCGTITAASGLTLYVYDSRASGVSCADATSLVKKFHATIAGRQSAGSNAAVDATVDGWLCTSGPPAAQGGTTCSKGEQTVLAAVVPAE